MRGTSLGAAGGPSRAVPPRPMFESSCCAVSLSSWSCRERSLRVSEHHWSVSSNRLDFGEIAHDAVPHRTLTLSNESRAPLNLALIGSEGFSAEQSVTLPAATSVS